jgi:hypothetical protein
MDHIDRHLATAATNDSYKSSIKAALVIGKKLLNKYYSYTDHSEMYRIAMGAWSVLWASDSLLTVALVLHPSHKLEYFKQADWDDEWREAALDIVRTTFELAYVNFEVEDDDNGNEVSTDSFRVSVCFLSFLITGN